MWILKTKQAHLRWIENFKYVKLILLKMQTQLLQVDERNNFKADICKVFGTPNPTLSVIIRRYEKLKSEKQVKFKVKQIWAWSKNWKQYCKNVQLF